MNHTDHTPSEAAMMSERTFRRGYHQAADRIYSIYSKHLPPGIAEDFGQWLDNIQAWRNQGSPDFTPPP